MADRKSGKRKGVRWSCGILTAALSCSLLLSGCQVVEPEKRAYPLVIGIDWQEGAYQVCLGMAQLAESTGQGKEGGEEQQGDGEGALLLTGTSREEIQELYGRTRELYLDPGHVQAVVLGEGLIREQERLRKVLLEMETDTALGNSAYVFAAEKVEQVMGENGIQVESLGEFLSGIYENRTQTGKPITLAVLYRNLHNEGKVPRIPGIRVEENQIFVDKAGE